LCACDTQLFPAFAHGGSTSVREGWEKLRIAGAQVREMLIAGAAAEWGVPASSVKAANGMLTGPGGKKSHIWPNG